MRARCSVNPVMKASSTPEASVTPLVSLVTIRSHRWQTACVWLNPPCTLGGPSDELFLLLLQGPDPQALEPTCAACHPSCIDCRGPGAWNCTVCPALLILSDEGRCLSCCGNETPHGDGAIPHECCDCSASSGGQEGGSGDLRVQTLKMQLITHLTCFSAECILGVNFVFDPIEDLKVQGGAASRFATVCVLLILSTGFGFFIFLNLRAGLLSTPCKPNVAGYKKVDSNGEIAPKPVTTSGEFSDWVVQCGDKEDDDDIVYMSNDGTVYRKFKYALLTDEEEIELDYDDETYSYKWKKKPWLWFTAWNCREWLRSASVGHLFLNK